MSLLVRLFICGQLVTNAFILKIDCGDSSGAGQFKDRAIENGPNKSLELELLHAMSPCFVVLLFLAESTNVRAYSTALYPSVRLSVTYVLWLNGAKYCPKQQIGNDPWGIEWSRDR